jgi:hypothetical protein
MRVVDYIMASIQKEYGCTMVNWTKVLGYTVEVTDYDNYSTVSMSCYPVVEAAVRKHITDRGGVLVRPKHPLFDRARGHVTCMNYASFAYHPLLGSRHVDFHFGSRAIICLSVCGFSGFSALGALGVRFAENAVKIGEVVDVGYLLAVGRAI